MGGFGTPTPPAGLSNVVAIATGSSHVLALRNDGSVIAWGIYGAGQTTNIPPGLTGVVKVVAGSAHNAALRGDGTVVCWGSGPATNVPAGLSNVVLIAGGHSHSLAIKIDGSVVAWGAGTNLDGTSFIDKGQSMVPPGLRNTLAIAGGQTFSLAVTNASGAPSIQVNQPVKVAAKFDVSLSTQQGRVYALECKNSLDESNWKFVSLGVGDGTVRTLTDTAASELKRFYRVREW